MVAKINFQIAGRILAFGEVEDEGPVGRRILLSREIFPFPRRFSVRTRSTASLLFAPEMLGTRWNASLPALGCGSAASVTSVVSILPRKFNCRFTANQSVGSWRHFHHSLCCVVACDRFRLVGTDVRN